MTPQPEGKDEVTLLVLENAPDGSVGAAVRRAFVDGAIFQAERDIARIRAGTEKSGLLWWRTDLEDEAARRYPEPSRG